MKKRHLTVMPGVLLALLLTGLLIACPGTTDPDPVAVESVSIDGGDTDAIVGTNETLTATVLPETATNQTVTWESSVPTVATIDSASGEVTPLTAGTTVITVTTTDGSLQEDSITLTVSTTNVAVTGVIIVQGATASVTMVETLGLTATVSPETATDSSVTWESGSETVATIDSDGVVTPLTEGTTVITVTTNGVNSGGTQESADITITVTKEAITGLLIYSNITTTSGTEATASPTWDPVLGDQTVSYTIDPVLPNGITMADGVVTVGVDATVAPAATYTVTATGTGNYEGTITANIVITVNTPPPTNIALASANLVTVTTNVPSWWTVNDTIEGLEGLVNVNDGNKSTEGDWDSQAHPTGARGKHITFTFNETYSNGSFLFYNRVNWTTGGANDPRLRINGATVQFYKDNTAVGTKGTLNGGSAIDGIITITQAIDVVFNKVVMTFPDENDEDNNQNFREIEIMGIPAP